MELKSLTYLNALRLWVVAQTSNNVKSRYSLWRVEKELLLATTARLWTIRKI